MTASVPTIQGGSPDIATGAFDGSSVATLRFVSRVRGGLVAALDGALELFVDVAHAGLDTENAASGPTDTAAITGRVDPRITRSLTFPSHRS